MLHASNFLGVFDQLHDVIFTSSTAVAFRHFLPTELGHSAPEVSNSSRNVSQYSVVELQI
jgi:hypothetical protein